MANSFGVQWMRIALLNFLLAALTGVLLRWIFVAELPLIDFRKTLQAHSHLALLGWVYLAVIILLNKSFVSSEKVLDKAFVRLFIAIEISILLMFVSFLVFGYRSWSIVFLVIYMLITLLIVRCLLIGRVEGQREQSNSGLWMKTSLFFLVFSFVGPISLEPISALGLKGTSLYYLAIQYFLHFQFNGWLVFAIFALFFRVLELNNIRIQRSLMKNFYWFLLSSAFLTFALGVAWSNPYTVVYVINSIAVILQLIAAIYLWLIVQKNKKEILKILDNGSQWIFKSAFYCFLAKIFIQTLVVFPVIAVISLTIRWYIIGFIHLILLGFVSMSIFAISIQSKLMRTDSNLTQFGLMCFFSAFILTEILLFSQGTMLWAQLGFLPYFYEILFLFSVFLPFSIFIIYYDQRLKDPVPK